MTDRSNGYERIAPEFLAGRGRQATAGVGAARVRAWARTLPVDSRVLDLGCGTGYPITEVLVQEGLKVRAIDASPSLVAAFRRHLPDVPVICEAVEESTFFGQSFDAVLAWGLWFLLPVEAQRSLLRRVALAVVPGGRLLFTAPAHECSWPDAMTGLESRSLGAPVYRTELAACGFAVVREYDDEGDNHYYDATRTHLAGPAHTAAV